MDMAIGDIAPGSRRFQPGTDPQAAILQAMAREGDGAQFSCRALSDQLDLTPGQCRYALHALAGAGLVSVVLVWGNGRRPAKYNWGLTSKGREAVRTL